MFLFCLRDVQRNHTLRLDFTKAEYVKIYMFMQAVYFPYEREAMVGFNTDQTCVFKMWFFSSQRSRVRKNAVTWLNVRRDV